MKKVIFSAALLCLAMGAHAEKTSAFTLGASLSIDASDYINQVDSDLPANISLEQEAAGGPGADVYAAFMFAKASTVRVGHRTFGIQEADIETNGVEVGSFEMNSDGMYAAVDLMFPLGDTFFLGGTLGLQEWDAEVDIAGTKFSDSGRDPFFGVRGKWKISDVGAITGGINRYKFNTNRARLNHDIEYTAVSGGFEFFF